MSTFATTVDSDDSSVCDDIILFRITDDSFAVGPSFELLFDIRPRSPTGLLLHVGNLGRTRHGALMGHYLSVYMLRGEVSLREISVL